MDRRTQNAKMEGNPQNRLLEVSADEKGRLIASFFICTDKQRWKTDPTKTFSRLFACAHTPMLARGFRRCEY